MTTQPIHFTDENFDAEVLQSDQPVLVDVWAEWCGPCRLLGPTIDELAEQYDGSVKVGKLDEDENPQTAAAHQVSSIPTVLLFQNGEVLERFVGVQPKQRYEEALQAAAVGAH